MKNTVKKADVAKRLVWGEVVVPNRPFVPDRQYDGAVMFMTADEIEKLAYRYMANKHNVGVDLQHTHKLIPGCTVVESFIARAGDPDFTEGAWVVCAHVDDDDTWEKIEKNELNGFSMEAGVLFEDVEVEMDIPDTITGETSEDEGHAHTFSVSFNKDGVFEGGKTGFAENHYHRIVGGTVTEETNGHKHRFSSVDNVVVTEIPKE